MNTTTEVDLSIKELADRARRTPRQINNWKAAAERRLGRKLGYPDPVDRRITRFTPEDAREILKAGMNQEDGTEQPPQPQHPDFSHADANAEAGIFGGMDSIVQMGDQNAITIGAAIGQRWNQLVWTSALQTMQGGMVQMQQQFEEMHQSVSLTLGTPQLPGSHPNVARLEGEEE
ncbi:hypothetical protein K9N68_10790 [Kovacikia minuta CCNUW1]|uniref:hypothetical protein n=1 Tax=Kovacikia minuta TaxID=2931930 RepID=UPI001CCF5FA9|nr:hypothetical protein [Kovacikia minuta]UBF28315.1 hypothetical protein K9N68_10790 [Kovacikia minuta CCNUW1]